MRGVLNISLLVVTAAVVTVAVAMFGGVVLPYAAPLYWIGAGLALLWAAKLVLLHPVSWTRAPLHWPVLAFAGYALIRYFTMPAPALGRVELLHIGLVVLVYFVGATTLRRERDQTTVVLLLAALGFVESVYGLWQFTTKSSVVLHLERHLQYQGRASGTFFNPNHFGGFLELVFGLLLAHIVIRWTGNRHLQQRALQKIFHIYCALFVVAGLYGTLSRATWIATGVGVVAFLLWCWYSGDLRPRVVDAGLLVAVAAGVLFVSRPALRERFAGTVTINPHYTFESDAVQLRDVTAGGRTLMWQATGRMIRDHPLFGVGPGMWVWMHPTYRDPGLQIRPEYAHGDLLQLGAHYGVIGWLLGAAALGCFFWQVARIARRSHSSGERAFAIGSGVAVTALLVHSLADFNLQIPANALIVALLMGMTVAMGPGDNFRWRGTLPRLVRWSLALALLVLAVFLGWRGGRLASASRAVQAGNEARSVFDWDKALDHYERALQLDPRTPATYVEIGELYRVRSALADSPEAQSDRQRFAREALDAFTHALALNPYDSDALLRMASAAELATDLPQARAAYDRALQVDPHNGFAQYRLGLFHYRNNDRDAAHTAFSRARQLLPGDPTITLYLKALAENL